MVAEILLFCFENPGTSTIFANIFYLQAVENRLCISIKTVEWLFFCKLEKLQVLGVEKSGGATELNVTSFEAFVTIYLSITIINYTKYLIIKLSLLKKCSKNYYPIFDRLCGRVHVCQMSKSKIAGRSFSVKK
jgi:hypothetical protein